MKIRCSGCKSFLKVEDSLAGKKGKCPKCGNVFQIPAVAPSPPGAGAGGATDRQKEYAKSLGIEFPPDITKAEISALISQAVERREGERFHKLDELSDRESEAYQQLRAEVVAEIDETDSLLSKATPSQMVEELGARNKGAILITFDPDDLNIEDIAGARLAVSFSDNITETEMRAVLVGLGAHISRQAGL